MALIGISNTIPNIVNLPGQSGGGSVFSSTKALEFDGTDDYVGCGANATLQPTGAFTVSGWIYIDDLANNNVILANNTSVGANGYVLWITAATTNAIFTVYTGATYGWVAVQGTTSFVTGQWYHVAGTYEGTSADMKIYVNGQLENTVSSTATPITYTGAGGYIGKYSVQRTEGKIDEVALFGSALGAPVIDSIFNSGVPTDLTSLSPIAWWRCGENATFKSPQILMPEQSNKDKVSNYSMDFDGTSDYVDCGISTASTDFSFSCWVKHSGTFAANWRHVAFCSLTTSNIQYGGFCCYHSTGTDLVLGVWNNKGTTQLGTGWNHIMGVWDDTTKTCELYLNGALELTYSPAGWSDISRTLEIGDVITGNYPSSFDAWNGNIDEFAYWTSKLTLSDAISIYNSGEPTDLTSLTPSAWWRMGEEATYDAVASEWTIPDQAGSNDGTSVNMDIYTRIGDAPDSLNNVLSYNMDAADIVPR